MDPVTFDRFIGLLDAHWADPARWVQMATELAKWRTAEARRLGHRGPVRQYTNRDLKYLCWNAVSRASST
jgi:hypothetical protein